MNMVKAALLWIFCFPARFALVVKQRKIEGRLLFYKYMTDILSIMGNLYRILKEIIHKELFW